MQIFITEEFVSEVKSISKDKSHSECETDLINSIFKKSIDEIKNVGTKRLGGQADKSPFLRKRLGSETSGKSGGYRLYFWLFILDKNIFYYSFIQKQEEGQPLIYQLKNKKI